MFCACGENPGGSRTESAEEAKGLLPTEVMREPEPTASGIPTEERTEEKTEDDSRAVVLQDAETDTPETTEAETPKPVTEPAAVAQEEENGIEEETDDAVPEETDPMQEWKLAVITQVQALDEQYGEICVIDREAPEGHRCGNRYSLLSISGYMEPALLCLPPTGMENAVLYVWQEGKLTVYASGEDCGIYTEEQQMDSGELLEQMDAL